MAALTPQVADIDGLDLTLQATEQGVGDTFRAAEDRVLVVRNTTGGAINLTIVTPGTVDGLAIEDRVIAVPANTTRYYGLGSATAYSTAAGIVTITAASVGLEVGVLEAS